MSEPQRRRRFTQRSFTLLITNMIKLAGAVLAIHEGFGHRDAVTLGVAAFMMAGAQLSEELILGIVDRIFGPGGEQPPTQEGK